MTRKLWAYAAELQATQINADFHFHVKTDFYEFLEINTSKKLRDLVQLLVALGIMSNHIHLVFRSTNGIPPGQLLGSFKRHTSMAVVKAIKGKDKVKLEKKICWKLLNAMEVKNLM